MFVYVGLGVGLHCCAAATHCGVGGRDHPMDEYYPAAFAPSFQEVLLKGAVLTDTDSQRESWHERVYEYNGS